MKSVMKRRKTDTKKKMRTARITAVTAIAEMTAIAAMTAVTGMFLLFLTGCTETSADASVAEEAKAALPETATAETAAAGAAPVGAALPEEENPVQTELEQAQPEPEKTASLPEETAPPEQETAPPASELGSPRSSYGLGSAAFLKGRNLLVSVFVTTPESGWTGREQEEVLQKLGTAADYIEGQAEQYGVGAELIYDWSSQQDLKAETETDFPISEDADFVDRLDEEIACWLEEEISYEKLLETYDAEGIAACVFVNNPGISYAIVYDGTDNVKESMILFTGDYYHRGKEETAAAYAHEILHVFGAHDLYEDAEFTKEVTDYVADAYPNEIMFTVSGAGAGKITQIVSPVTAYHLGWISDTEEIDRFPQLNRDGNNVDKKGMTEQ